MARKSPMRPHEAFLKDPERGAIQRMFEKWNNNLKPGRLISTFYSEDLIRGREKQEFDCKKTDYAKSEFLYETCLMRATYLQIQKVRKVLAESDDEAHLELAKMLPVRKDDHYWDQFEKNLGDEPDTMQSESSKESVAQQATDGDSHQQHSQHYDSHQQHSQHYDSQQQHSQHYDSHRPQHHKPMDTKQPTEETGKDSGLFSGNLPQQPSGFSGQASPTMPSPQQSTSYPSPSQGDTASAAARADHSQRQQGRQQGPAVGTNQQPQLRQLSCYKTRLDNKPRGNGFVLVIANFTRDPAVQTYEHDITKIHRFFHGILGYTVQIFKDLTKQQCLDLLTRVQQDLNQNTTYDRFFLFFLSHGDEIGIKTTLDGSNDEMDHTGRPMHLDIDEDIVRKFTHDKILTLKGFPKIFFIQACAGEQIAQAAGGAESNICRAAAKSEKITVGADTLVCYASQKGDYAWVDRDGSWLIQESMNVFERYYLSEHLLDMLTEVNDIITKKGMRGMVQNQPFEEVRQLPTVSHNLTKKLYLTRNT